MSDAGIRQCNCRTNMNITVFRLQLHCSRPATEHKAKTTAQVLVLNDICFRVCWFIPQVCSCT
jgi:hypothetical protein